MAEYQNRPAEEEPQGDAKSVLREYVDASRIKHVFPIAVTIIYLAVSFATGWWAYTWILFLFIPFFYAALPIWDEYRAFNSNGESVDMRGNGNAPGFEGVSENFRIRPRRLKRLIITAVAPLYFIISFATGAWAVTWIVFLLVPLAQGVIRD